MAPTYRKKPVKLTFWGAARQVTGSMYLLELDDDYRILIDCGTDLSRPDENAPDVWPADMKNRLFPFEPSFLNAVLLTHAHIDHSGEIPNLIREGFEGKIFCTPATYDLTQPLLLDSAMLHRKRLNRIMGNDKRGNKKVKPTKEVSNLYLEKDAEESFDYFATIPFLQRVKLRKGVWMTFIPTGHILGAANILLEIEEDGVTKRIGFSGDIGRHNYPLLKDPYPFPEVDYLICESTYGNRYHKDEGDPVQILGDLVRKTCVDIPGRLVIPAFAVGRTQALLFTLNKVYADLNFPQVRVFTDSPLALKSTAVYEKYPSLLNDEAREFRDTHGELFDFKNLTFVENAKDSKALSDYNRPCVIISSSGMISGGRVEHHVRQNLSNPYSTILLVGYSAEGTIGHDLLHGKKSFEWDKREYAVTCTIAHTDVFSGHGDLDDLIAWVSQQDKTKVKKVFLVHGDYKSQVDFAATLAGEGYDMVEIPAKGQTYDL